jgi:hypothetical protein
MADSSLVDLSINNSSEKERPGVVLRYFDYEVVRGDYWSGPFLQKRREKRVTYLIQFEDLGIGLHMATVDERVDACAALIREGDNVLVQMSKKRDQATVRPSAPWLQVSCDDKASPWATKIAAADTERRGEYYDEVGIRTQARLIRLAGHDVPIVVSKSLDLDAASKRRSLRALAMPQGRRQGVVLSATTYVHFERIALQSPLIKGRKVEYRLFFINFPQGSSYERMAVHQPCDEASAQIQEGDLVEVVSDAALNASVQPIKSVAARIRNSLSRGSRRRFHT